MWVPGAVTFGGNCANRSGFRTRTLGVALHVNDAPQDASLWAWVNNPNSNMSSHFQGRTNGDVEQYLDTDLTSWCQADGNNDYISYEAPTVPGVGMTDAQVRSFARVIRALSDHYGFPLQLAETPGDLGIIWHGAGGDAWGGHYGCPGPIRRDQRATAIAFARGDTNPIPTPQPTPEDDPMPLLIHAPNRGFATDVGGFVPLGDPASLPGSIAAGMKTWEVGDADWDRMNAAANRDNGGMVIYNPNRGFALVLGSQATRIADPADLQAYREAGLPLITLSGREFAVRMGETVAPA